MYNLPYHKEKDPEVIRAFVAQYPFAFLTGCDAQNRPVATQIPVFLEELGERLVLRGHIMKNTDHHKAFAHNPNVLAVFTGQHTYVSGTWYTNPHTPSTWNYMSVHVRGTIRFFQGEELEAVMRKTTLHFEGHNPASTTVYDNVPEEFRRKYMPAIVGFEIEVQELDNVFKLSQDRDYESYHNIMAELRKQGTDAQQIAQEMENRLPTQFPDQGK
jgi:transcriptional regulator